MESKMPGYEFSELMAGFSKEQLENAIDLRRKRLERDGCKFIRFDPDGDKKGMLVMWAPLGYVPPKWFDSKGFVIFWLIFFNPVGWYGAVKGSAFSIKGKLAISALCIALYIWIGVTTYTEATAAWDAGFTSSGEMKEAKKLGILTGDQYRNHLREQEAIKARLYPEQKKPVTVNQRDLSDYAMSACKLLIKRELSNPDSADFPWPDEFIITKFGDGKTYSVKSYVTAQNQYGATVRQEWFCKLIHDGSSETNIDSWGIDSIVFI